MEWTVDPSRDAPPWRQLVEKVQDALVKGDLVAGGALLSVRKMAGEALVNPNTVARAYRELEQAGVVAGQNGRGVFVTTMGPKIAMQQRGAATWTAFEEATIQALESGHDLDSLVVALRKLAKESTNSRSECQGVGDPLLAGDVELQGELGKVTNHPHSSTPRSSQIRKTKQRKKSA